jgi:hypothetical protein
MKRRETNMYTLIVIVRLTGQAAIFIELPVFSTLAECQSVQEGWLNVPTDRGHITAAICDPPKGQTI